MKAKLVAAAAALALAATLVWAVLCSETPRKEDAGAGADGASSGAAAPVTLGASRASSEAAREVIRTPLEDQQARSASGARVLVRTTWPGGTPAAGIVVHARQALGPPLGRSGTTREDGTLRFEDLHAGWCMLQADRTTTPSSIVLEAGEAREVTLMLPDGINVRGVVVDSAGHPVAGAELLLSHCDKLPQLTDVVGQSACDGTFALRAIQEGHIVGARARGHGTSAFYHLPSDTSELGTPVRLDLVLPDDSATLTGGVVDPQGKALAGAFVRIGRSDIRLVRVDSGVAQSSPPVHLTADAKGRFSAAELASGPQTVHAYVNGFAPFDETFELERGQSRDVVLRLQPGATLLGKVTDIAGEPAPHVLLEVGDYDYPECRSAKTDQDGDYRLDDLRPGPLSVRVGEEQRGIVRMEVEVAAGKVTRWNFHLPPGLRISGRLFDHRDQPLSGWRIRAEDPSALGYGQAECVTGQQGTFSIPNVDDQPYRLRVFEEAAPAPTVWIAQDLRPGDHRIVVPERARAKGTLRGRVLLPNGQPAAGAEISLRQGEVSLDGAAKCDAADGSFTTRGLPPGSYDLRVSLKGYEDVCPASVELPPGENKVLDDLRFLTLAAPSGAGRR